jgi:hypothetical protein
MIVNKRRRQALIFQIHVLVRGAEEPVAAVRSESDALLRREKRESWIEGWMRLRVLCIFFFLSPNPLGYKMRVYFILQNTAMGFRFSRISGFSYWWLILDFNYQLTYSNWILDFFNKSQILDAWMLCWRRWKGKLNQKN